MDIILVPDPVAQVSNHSSGVFFFSQKILDVAELIDHSQLLSGVCEKLNSLTNPSSTDLWQADTAKK